MIEDIALQKTLLLLNSAFMSVNSESAKINIGKNIVKGIESFDLYISDRQIAIEWM